MSSFKPIDGSKEDFRKYLDRKGVMDAITKVLIKCNSERPDNAIEFLLENMGEKLQDKHTISCLENDLAEARNEIEALKRQIESLKMSAVVPPSAEISNGSSPVGEGAPDSVVSEEAPTTDKEAKVVPAAEATAASPDVPAGGDATGEQQNTSPLPTETVPKEQVAQ